MWVEGREREKLVGIENTYCWLCWWQCNCLPFLRPGWQCWPHWPSAGPGRGGPLRGMRGTNCPWRHHHETEQHPLLSRNKEIPLDRDTGKGGNSQWWRGRGRCEVRNGGREMWRQAPWFQRTCETKRRPHGSQGQISVTDRVETRVHEYIKHSSHHKCPHLLQSHPRVKYL